MQVTFLLTRQTIFIWFPASQIAIVASRFADASQPATMPAMAMHVTEVVIQLADWHCDLKGNNDLLVLSQPQLITDAPARH